MTKSWCEADQDFVPSKEVKTFGGVQVHLREPWHLLLTGEVVEVRDGEVVLDPSSTPVVALAEPVLDAVVDDEGD
jgi:hypothetical protein